jgi:hypothetical protein
MQHERKKRVHRLLGAAHGAGQRDHQGAADNTSG